MKLRTRTLTIAVAMGLATLTPSATLVATAGAAPAASPARSDGRNAALYYWRAFYTLDRDFQRESADLLPADRAPDWAPDAGTVAKLKGNGAFIRELLVATRIDRCDFGIAYEEGFMALLPHLGLMRSSSRILVLDARRLLAEGDFDAAAERLAGIIRMGVHMRNDNVLISALVSMAVTSLAAGEAEVLAGSGKLTAAGRDTILGALQPLNQADGFGVKRCLEMERNMTIDYLRKRLTGPDAGKKLLEIGLIEVSPEMKQELSGFDEAAVGADLDKVDTFYKELLGAWDDADHAAKLKGLESRLEKGEFGVLAKLMVPSVFKAKSSDLKSADRVREVIRQLSTATLAAPPEAEEPPKDAR
jgi:hypothetical protein